MARPAGSRNADYTRKRAQLVEKLAPVLLKGGAGVSLRELSERTDVSVSNLKHYFVDRDGLVEAVLLDLQSRGAPHMKAGTLPQGVDAQSSLLHFLERFVAGWHRMVGIIHQIGLGEGMGSPRLGPVYVNTILEPTLNVAERLLEALVARGDIPALDLRTGALTLVSPVLLAMLHQDTLGGARCRPLDLPRFLQDHVRSWLHGNGTSGRAGTGSPVAEGPGPEGSAPEGSTPGHAVRVKSDPEKSASESSVSEKNPLGKTDVAT